MFDPGTDWSVEPLDFSINVLICLRRLLIQGSSAAEAGSLYPLYSKFINTTVPLQCVALVVWKAYVDRMSFG